MCAGGDRPFNTPVGAAKAAAHAKRPAAAAPWAAAAKQLSTSQGVLARPTAAAPGVAPGCVPGKTHAGTGALTAAAGSARPWSPPGAHCSSAGAAAAAVRSCFSPVGYTSTHPACWQHTVCAVHSAPLSAFRQRSFSVRSSLCACTSGRAVACRPLSSALPGTGSLQWQCRTAGLQHESGL